MPFGPTPEHCHFGSGYIDLPLSLHTALTEAILTSLVAQGFRRMRQLTGMILIWILLTTLLLGSLAIRPMPVLP
jgi:hypothetical protein